jgi:hypothetical protein
MPLLADRRCQPFGHPDEPNASVLWRRQLAAPVRVPYPNLPSLEIDVGPFECDDLARPQPSLASEESDKVSRCTCSLLIVSSVREPSSGTKYNRRIDSFAATPLGFWRFARA